MSVKLQKISEIRPSLPFTEFDFQQKYLESFKQSELGCIHAQLPLKELAEKGLTLANGISPIFSGNLEFLSGTINF